MKLKRRILSFIVVLFCITGVNSQNDFLKKYFSKEKNDIVKMHALALDNDSANFFGFTNPFRSKALAEKNYPLLCYIYAKYAVYFHIKNNAPIAFMYYDSIIETIKNEKLPEYMYFTVYKNRGSLKFKMENYSGALKDYKRYEEIILKYKVGDIGSIYESMASIYVMVSDAKNAKKYALKALPFVNLRGDKREYIRVVRSLSTVYFLEGQYRQCDSLNKIATKLSKENNLIIDYGECLEEYTGSLKRQNRLEEAKQVYYELLKVTSEVEDSDWELEVLLEISKLDLLLSKPNDAKNILLLAEKIKPTETMPEQEKSDIYRNFAWIYDTLGLYKKSSMMLKKYMQVVESGVLTQGVLKLNQVTNEYERKQDSINTAREAEYTELANLRQKEKADYQLKQQRSIILISIVGFIVVVVFSFSLLKANRAKEKANKEISLQKGLLSEKNKEITDSITYAKHIQQSLLPPLDILQILLPQHFLVYKPKDIVSGDFYWAKKINANEVFIAVADCTGHGVPGAMMSALSIQNLNELSSQTRSPSELLSLLNTNLRNTLNQDQEGFSKDGLDICLCKISRKEKKITYSGANRSLQIFNEKGLKIEIRATKTGIGGHTLDNQKFAEHEIELGENDMVVMSTDGFADQFGGNENKKITTKRFKEWVTEIIFINDKKAELEARYNAWKGSVDQIDDVCVLGFKI